MKLNIRLRTKLIFSFLSIILVPVMLTIICGLLIFNKIIVIPELNLIEETQEYAYKIRDAIQDNYSRIDNPEYMNNLLEPIYTPYFDKIEITNNTNVTQYNSLDYTEDKASNALRFSNKDKVMFSENIVDPKYKEIILGEVSMVSKLTYNDTIKRFVIVIGLLGGVFILSMALMVTLLSKILSEGILRPLEELNFATERISSGDLNFSLSYKDDNEMGRVCQQFETMRDKLKESLETQNHYERSRKELIASITHDLKTPLTSIKGYVEGLQDGLVKDKITYDRYLNVIHSKAEKLNYLIDDLFIFSQLELNKFAVNPEPLDISEVLDRYFDYKELDIKNQNINLILEEPFVKEIILLDEFRIGQVLENLVQNALKFTKSYIRVSTKITDDKYIIMIEDDGIGICKDDQPFIFNHFFKCDKSRNSSSKGSGLGLAICKQIVDSHEGKISVDCTMKVGCLFKIELPRRKENNAANSIQVN